MQLPRLDISIEFAKLGLQIQKSSIEIRQPAAEVTIRQPQPDMKIIKTRGKLEIDQSEAFADANVKHISTRTKEWSNQAKQKVLQDLAQEASEGKRLMSIETKNKNTIAQIAKDQTTPSQKPANIKFIPETPLKVRFHYTPSEIDIKIEQHEPTIKITPQKPIIKYNVGDVQIYMRQKSSLHFKVIGNIYDRNI